MLVMSPKEFTGVSSKYNNLELHGSEGSDINKKQKFKTACRVLSILPWQNIRYI
jgi:hypothetical protein